MQIFNPKAFDATLQPMWFGEPVNVVRFDKAKYKIFLDLTEKQLSFFWRPTEVDLSMDAQQFRKLPENEQHIFTSNLLYQSLLDSVQGRSPGMIFKAATSLPEIESFTTAWAFFEANIHANSYTHIIRNIYPDPSSVLDSIMLTPEIMERAEAVTQHLEIAAEWIHDANVSDYGKMRRLYLALIATNVLEGLRFYVSFACSFAFAERKQMEGNAKIIKLIARDEAIHLSATQHMINILKSGREGDGWVQITEDCEDNAYQIFQDAIEQEKAWAKYLFNKGSMIGLNTEILCQYVDFIAAQRMKAIGLKPFVEVDHNPLPWMNSWLNSSNLQVAPQETEIETYLVGQVDASIDLSEFEEV